MDKRRNIVFLDGPLAVEEVKVVVVEGSAVLSALCWMTTDHPALGGRHRVVAYGVLARKVIAFAQAEAAEGRAVDATVDGHLRSGDEASVVVAERVVFHTSGEVAERARRWLESGE
ncbi:MAG: hypothetical protein JW900_06530 [Anaerolineae bacterium]|nr:hypothetical protein [Anaerolineae bacterium]